MTRALVFCLACATALLGCNVQRTVCPAYQSAFLFDKTAERNMFVVSNVNKSQPQEVLASNGKAMTLPARDSSWDISPVIQAPSLPIARRVKKDRYLLLPTKTYRKALRALQTVPMKAVYPKKEVDSLDIKKALDSAARSITDTITNSQAAKSNAQANDSVYVITTAKEKFNVDQDNYMWYFRDILVLPDVKLAMDAGKSEKAAKATEDKKMKTGFFQKLLGLFKKKPKAKMDSASLSDKAINPTDSTGASSTQPIAKKKKGLGGLFKKSPKVPIAPAKKPEGKKEEDDGF